MEENKQDLKRTFTFDLNKPTRCKNVYTREIFDPVCAEKKSVPLSLMEAFPSRCDWKYLMHPQPIGTCFITKVTDDQISVEVTPSHIDIPSDWTIAPRALKKPFKQETGIFEEKMIALISFDLIPPHPIALESGEMLKTIYAQEKQNDFNRQ